MRLSLVVPCFNEEASVERLHEAVTAAVAELTDVDFEVVYVDDGSSRRHPRGAARARRRRRRVRYTSR